MTAPAAAPSTADAKTLAAIDRLQKRVAELEAELAAKERLNRELTEAAKTSRDFKASVAAGYIDTYLEGQ